MTIDSPRSKEPDYTVICIKYDRNRATIDDIGKAVDDIPGATLDD